MPRKVYTEEMDEWLRQNVKGVPIAELTKRLNQTFNINVTTKAMYQKLHRLNLNNGVGPGFKKGFTPFNKGKKRTDYMCEEKIKNCEKTQFTKGLNINNSNHNVLPTGTERVNKDGYIIVKLPESRKPGKHGLWISKHQYVYEQHYGKIPKDHVVIFADGNNRNFDINNLICVSKTEQCVLNTRKLIVKDFPEATKTGVLITKIYMKEKERKEKNAKQQIR